MINSITHGASLDTLAGVTPELVSLAVSHPYVHTATALHLVTEVRTLGHSVTEQRGWDTEASVASPLTRRTYGLWAGELVRVVRALKLSITSGVCAEHEAGVVHAPVLRLPRTVILAATYLVRAVAALLVSIAPLSHGDAFSAGTAKIPKWAGRS